jgi:NNP family nitrate/nitrite transporter-like MFS transporter
MISSKFDIFSFQGKMRTLHISWIAFFITFFVWFNHAPLLQAIGSSLNLTSAQLKSLLTINVALAIPARVIVGMLTDRYGPRLVFSLLLAVCSIPCFMFAAAQSYEQLAFARLLLGFIGAGFVIGIRLVSEWFPANELGIAEGIYGGWGNFGSAVAAFTLPALALFYGDEGWRLAIALTGLISLVYSFIFYWQIRNTPKGSTYFKPKTLGALEITSKLDFFLLLIAKLPMYGAIAILAWQLSPGQQAMIASDLVYSINVVLVILYLYEVLQIWRVNGHIFREPVPLLHQYKFKQVIVLNCLYFATFGSELAVISMLPLFFAEVFSLDPVLAGMVAAAYAFMNLMSRPAGGWLSDKFGRKSTLLILTAGLALGYLAMSLVNSDWPLWLAVITAMTCSFFVQSGEGAVFAVVPLIKRRLTGQIAGMTGAYGNVGAVVYLSVFALVDYQTFFLTIAGSSVFGFAVLLFLEEPRGQMSEIREDGSVELISVT